MTAADWIAALFIGALHLWVGFRFGRAAGRNESIERLRALDAESALKLRVIRGGRK